MGKIITYANFTKIYHQYVEEVYSYSFAILKDPHSTQEVVQITFINFWDSRHQANPSISPKVQLLRIAKLRSIDHLRREARTKTRVFNLERIDLAERENIEAKLLSEEKIKSIEHAIDQLPEKRKLILKMAKLENKSHKEIAELLSISVKTVENQLLQAKRTLRQKIAAFLYNFL
jgi:RNA polymerase sigma-70 factor (ECF subfamily)